MLAGCSNKTPEPPVLNAITLDQTRLTLKVGESAELKVTTDPADYQDLKLTWTSSDTKIATVKNGKVTAIKDGKVKITAEAEGKTAVCSITVKRDIDKELREGLLAYQEHISQIYLTDEINSNNPEKGILVKLHNNKEGYTPIVFIYANADTITTEKGLLKHGVIHWNNDKNIVAVTEDTKHNFKCEITYDKKTYVFQYTINNFIINKTDNANVTLLSQQYADGDAADGFAYSVITKDAMYYPMKTKLAESSYTLEYEGKTVGSIKVIEENPVIEIIDPVTNKIVKAIIDTK